MTTTAATSLQLFLVLCDGSCDRGPNQGRVHAGQRIASFLSALIRSDFFLAKAIFLVFGSVVFPCIVMNLKQLAGSQRLFNCLCCVMI